MPGIVPGVWELAATARRGVCSHPHNQRNSKGTGPALSPWEVCGVTAWCPAWCRREAELSREVRGLEQWLPLLGSVSAQRTQAQFPTHNCLSLQLKVI